MDRVTMFFIDSNIKIMNRSGIVQCLNTTISGTVHIMYAGSLSKSLPPSKEPDESQTISRSL